MGWGSDGVRECGVGGYDRVRVYKDVWDGSEGVIE